MLMFMLCGINSVDLFNLREISSSGRVEYQRAKTHKLYSVKVEPEAMRIIEKYRGERFLLCPADRWSSHKDFTKWMNFNLKNIGDVKAYLERLYPEEVRKYSPKKEWQSSKSGAFERDGSAREGVELGGLTLPGQQEADRIYEESRRLYGRFEEGDPSVSADVDAIVIRKQEADQLFEDAFGAESEYYRHHLNENPWGLVNDPELTVDQQDAVLYCINAKAALDGVMDASTEAAERKRAEVEQSVAKRTHKDSGAITPATMKVDDREVYIVKGDVVMFPDGSCVDVHNSSESVVVMDAQSGEYEFTSPDQIFKVGENIDPEEEMRTALEAIEQEQGAIFGENGVPQTEEPGEAPAEEAGNNAPQNIPVPANVEEYDRGYEEGIQVGNSLDDENLNRAISDLRSRDWLSDEWRGRLEAYEYVQQERAQSAQPETDPSVGLKGPQTAGEAQWEELNKNAETTAEVTPIEPQAETALSRIPVDEKTGEPMFEAVDKELAWDGLVEDSADDAEAMEYAEGMVKKLERDVAQAQKALGNVKVTGDRAKFKADKRAARERLAEAEKSLEHWKGMVEVARRRAEEAERARMEVDRREAETRKAAAESERLAKAEAERERQEERNGVPDWRKDTAEAARARGLGGEAYGDISEGQRVTCRLSEEVNEFGKPFVISSDGTTHFGYIDKESGLEPLPIKLSLGENRKDDEGKDRGYGYLHIDAGHREQILQNGFSSIEEFVESVARNYTEIKEGAKIGENQTYLLEVSDDHNNTLFIQLSRDGKYWNVNSAGIFKKKYSRRKPKVYSKPAVGSGKDTDTTEVNSGQTKGATAPAGNSSETSERKVNAFFADNQISAEQSDQKVDESEDKQDHRGESSAERSEGNGSRSVQAAVEAASAEVDVSPTPAQADAGNYKKGHVTVGGFDIAIENPAGSVRKGVDADGKEWSTTMANAYGYINGTESADGDPLDVFLHSDMDQWDGRKVFVVDQTNTDGSFDEHKVMLGFNDREEAMSAYFANYDKTWTETHPDLRVSETSMEDFKKWVKSSHRKTKPFAEYSTVSKVLDGISPVDKQGEGDDASSLRSDHNPGVSASGVRLHVEGNLSEEGGSDIEHLKETYKPDGYGDFGPIFTQFKGKAREAIKLLTSLRSGEAIGALYHKDIGDIDLVWGIEGTAKSDGYGLAKLVKYHPEVIANLQEILDEMHIVKRSENRINLESDTHKAAVRLTWNKEKKKWLLTAFEKKETSESIDKTTDTDDNPKDLRGDTALSQNSDVSSGKDNTLPSDKQAAEGESSKGYTITATTYTRKKGGGETPVWVVKFGKELSKEEKAALRSFTREPLTEGKKVSKGWVDKDSGDYFMRSEEAAKSLAEMIGNEEAVADAQPMTADELREAVTPAPANVDSNVDSKTPYVDSNVDSKKPNVESTKPAKGKKPEKAPINRVSLDDVMTDLSSSSSSEAPKAMTEKGETRLSEHAEPLAEARGIDKKADAQGEVQYEISDEEMASLAEELRDLLGIGDDEGDKTIRFRDPGELTPQERQRIQSAGMRMAMGMIERGVTKFPNLAERMVAMLGDKIRPWLKSFYEGARWTPGYENYDFTPSEEVAKFDVENFDKPAYDVIKDAEMRVEERKAQQAAKQAEKELKETRNKQRKENDKQREADTAALAEKADAVAKQAGTDASIAGVGRTGEVRKKILRTISKADETLDEINDQLALLGYYEADLDAPEHEVYGLRRSAEKKAVKDAVRLARQLVDDLGLEVGKVSGKTTAQMQKSRGKSDTAVRANIASVGGDISINLPYTDGRDLHIYIRLTPTHERSVEPNRGGGAWEGDNYEVERIMFRFGDGRNHFLPTDVTYGKMLSEIKSAGKWGQPRKQEAPLAEARGMDKKVYHGTVTLKDGREAVVVAANHTQNVGETARLTDYIVSVKGEPGTIKVSPEEIAHAGAPTAEDKPSTPTKAEESHNGYKRGDEVMWDRNGNGKWEKQTIVDFDTDGSPILDSFGQSWIREKGDWSRIKPADGVFGEAKRVATKTQAEREKKEKQKQQSASSRDGQDLTTGSSTDVSAKSSAKITISDKKKTKERLEFVVSKYAGERKSRGFLSDLCEALGERKGAATQSRYFEFRDAEGNPITLRVSNHNANAANHDGKTPEISIVIKSRRQPNRFYPSTKAEVTEYVYFKEDIANGDGNTLSWIAKDISDMLDSGRYADSSGVAVVNISPAERATDTATDKAVEVLTGGRVKKSRKKDVTLKADEPVGGLFADLFLAESSGKADNEEPQKEDKDERTEMGTRSGKVGGQRQQLEQDTQMGGNESRRETERPAGETGGGSTGMDSDADRAGGGRVHDVAAQSALERLPEKERRNIHNNHVERGTEVAPKSESAPTNGDGNRYRDGEEMTDGERLRAIRALEPIEVERNELSREELREVYNNLPSVEKNGREIEFYRSAFKKIYKDGGLFGQVVPVLDEVLEQSVLAYSEEDNLGGTVRPDGTVHKEHPNVDSFDNYVGKVRLGGKEYYVRTTVAVQPGQSGAHAVFVSDIELYENTARSLSYPGSPRARVTSDGVVDAKLAKFFERASVEAEKIDMRERVEELSEKLNTPVRIIEDTDTPGDKPLSRRERRAKGWWSSRTDEVVVVLPNNVNVADVENTVVHEIIGHKGLRAFIGAERFEEFLREIYDHVLEPIRKKIDALATRIARKEGDKLSRDKQFLEECRKDGEAEIAPGSPLAKALGQAEAERRRKAGDYNNEATEEYMADLGGRIGDEGFEKMSRDEQTFWGKIKAKVQSFLDKFLRGLKIAKSIRLNDNDLAYILSKSWKYARDGKSSLRSDHDGGVFAEAKDAVRRKKSGWDDAMLSESAKIEDANKNFNKQITRYINGEMDKNELLYLGKPLGVMRQFLPELPIMMRQRVIRKGSEKKHEVDVESIVNMPKHLSSPIFVFQRSKNTIGVLTDMQDCNGKNVCVAIELSRQIQNGKECIEINDIRSFHGREFKNIVEPMVLNNTLKWVDKEKGLTYLSSASQPVQQEIDKEVLESAAKVVNNFENPKYEGDEEVRFRDGADYVERVPVMARGMYEKQIQTSMYQFTEAMQDSMRGLMEFYRAVESQGAKRDIEDVSNFENAYIAENLMSSQEVTGSSPVCSTNYQDVGIHITI